MKSRKKYQWNQQTLVFFFVLFFLECPSRCTKHPVPEMLWQRPSMGKSLTTLWTEWTSLYHSNPLWTISAFLTLQDLVRCIVEYRTVNDLKYHPQESSFTRANNCHRMLLVLRHINCRLPSYIQNNIRNNFFQDQKNSWIWCLWGDEMRI